MLAVGGLILAGCSNQHIYRGDAYDRINQEMQAAAESRPNRQEINEALGRAVVPPLQLDAPAAAKSEPRFNLAVNNAPVAQVLTALVSGTPYSMIFSPELEGSVSLNLKNVTVREVLDTLRDVYGYDYRVQGKRIQVQSNTLQTRLFKINYLANRRQGMSEMRVTGSSPTTSGPTNTGSGQSGAANNTNTGSTTGSTTQATDSARIRTSSDYDFWKDLGSALSLIVGNEAGRNVIVNANSGVVLVKAMPGELRSVEDYLKATQLVVERQVMLEAKILEVALNDSFQTGINWSKFGGVSDRFAIGVMAPASSIAKAAGTVIGSAVGAAGATGTVVTAKPGVYGNLETSGAGRGFFGLAFQSKDFGALLSFLEGQGNVQVLSSPRIATTNNQKAVLKVGTDDYFVTGISTNTTTSAAGNVVTPNITLQPFFSGIALDVTPQIDDSGNIILHVHPSVSVVEEKTKNVDLGDLGTFTLPLASSSISETDSIVRVQDGSIVAIGGLMSQQQINDRVGLPGISGVPGLGLLFGQKSGSQRKRELVILMRSTIISDDNGWRENTLESQQRLQGLDPRQRVLQWQ
jgi:MSHA biogenesis protein MshL